jgi:hypothetical protein
MKIIQAMIAAAIKPSFLAGLVILAIFLCMGRVYGGHRMRRDQA